MRGGGDVKGDGYDKYVLLEVGTVYKKPRGITQSNSCTIACGYKNENNCNCLIPLHCKSIFHFVYKNI